MKLTEYLKDKVLLLLLHMVCMAGLVIFLRLTGYSMDKCVIILVCYGVILAGWLFLQFFSRRSYFRKLEQLTDQLDRRYLLGELMPESFGLEDRKYRELIRKSNKSVIERIHQMEQNQKDYREYIESKGLYYDCRACKSPVFLRKALRSRKGGNVNAGI